MRRAGAPHVMGCGHGISSGYDLSVGRCNSFRFATQPHERLQVPRRFHPFEKSKKKAWPGWQEFGGSSLRDITGMRLVLYKKYGPRGTQ
jgi:hypothetical protein